MSDNPIQQELVIQNKFGFHTRTSARFAKTAATFQSQVTIQKGDETVDGKSILDLLTLAAGQGTLVVLTVSGHDQEPAFAALKELIETGFGEEK